MKYLFYSLCVVLFFSCDTEVTVQDLNGNTGGGSGGGTNISASLTATVNGTSYVADTVGAILVEPSGATTHYSISINSGTASPIQLLGVQFNPNMLEPATFGFDFSNPPTSTVLYGMGLTTFTTFDVSSLDNSGSSIVLTSIDTVNQLISGTFTAEVTDVMETEVIAITNGVFTNVPYTIE